MKESGGPRPGRRAFNRAAIGALVAPLVARSQAPAAESPNRAVYMAQDAGRDARLAAEAKKERSRIHSRSARASRCSSGAPRAKRWCSVR